MNYIYLFSKLLFVVSIIFSFYIMHHPETINGLHIQYIAYKNAQHEYIPDVYDCTQFSENLVKELRNEGYNAIKVCGFVDENNIYHITECMNNDMVMIPNKYDKNYIGHAWVYLQDYKMFIEATNGEIIDNQYVKIG